MRIIVVEALDAIIPNLPANLQKKSQTYLERRGVEFMLRSPIVGAQPDKVLLGGGKSISTRTFVWTCGIQGCEFAANLALTKGKCAYRKCNIAMTGGTCGGKDCTYFEGKYIEGKRGRLLVNEYMQSPDYPNVYVVGDVAWYLEGKKVIPQIVETAVQTAATAAHNIVAEITGGEMKPFKSNYHGIMVSLGTYSGVAHVMGISLTGIFAIAVKHMINVVHLFGVGGVNQVWEYVKHEFLDVQGLALVHRRLRRRTRSAATGRCSCGCGSASCGSWKRRTRSPRAGWTSPRGRARPAGCSPRAWSRPGVKAADAAAAADATSAASAAAARRGGRGRCGRGCGCHLRSCRTCGGSAAAAARRR